MPLDHQNHDAVDTKRREIAKNALTSLGIISYLGPPRVVNALTKNEPMAPLQAPVPKRMGGLANKIRNIAGVMVSRPFLL